MNLWHRSQRPSIRPRSGSGKSITCTFIPQRPGCKYVSSERYGVEYTSPAADYSRYGAFPFITDVPGLLSAIEKAANQFRETHAEPAVKWSTVSPSSSADTNYAFFTARDIWRRVFLRKLGLSSAAHRAALPPMTWQNSRSCCAVR